MAHEMQFKFISTVVKAFPEAFLGKHLEIGSEDINGNLRDLIRSSEYVGVDLGPGKNVTLIGRGEQIDFPSNFFDSCFSGECFEHNQNYLSTFYNMIRMTKPGGIVAFTCASRFRMEHGTTRSDGGSGAPSSVATGNEYYKNLLKKQFLLAIKEKQFLRYAFYRNFSEQDLYFVGIKKTTDNVHQLESRFFVLDKEISKQVKRMNHPYRVIKINIQLFRVAMLRAGINYLNRNLSKNTVNVLKRLIKNADD